MKLNKERLQIEMAKSCMNAYDLCKAAGFKYQTYRRVVNGLGCRPATVGRIAAALGCDVETIIQQSTDPGKEE